MRKGLIWMAAGLVAAQVAALQAETLGDALASAYKTSDLFKQNQAVLRATDEGVAVAIAALRPVIQFIAGASDAGKQTIPFGSTISWAEQQSASLSLTAQMTLYDFGASKTNIQIAKETVLATEQSLKGYEQQVLLAAAQAYVNVTLQTQMVAMQQSNVRLITEDLRATKDKFDVGEVTKTDVSQAEAQLAAAESQLAASQGALTLAREAYKAAVGHYPTNLAALPRAPMLPKSLGSAQDIAAKTNPSILAAQHQSRVADLRVTSAKIAMDPKIVGSVSAGASHDFYVTGFGAPSTSADQTFENLSAGVQLTQTLYAGGQLSALYRQALDQQDAAKSAVQLVAVQIAQQVGNAWSNLDVAAASIQAGDQQVAAAQAALDGVKQEFDVGSRTTLDVLNAQQALLNAQAARLQAVANLYTYQYTLLSSMGLMTADHLHLGVPIYDPKAYYNAVQNGPATSARGAQLDKIMKLMGRN